MKKSDTIRTIEIHAEVRQIKTMVDGTVNVVLNLPEYCIEQARILLGWQGDETTIIITRTQDDKRHKV